MGLFAICYVFQKMFHSSANFLIGLLFFFNWVIWVILDILNINHFQINLYKYLLPFSTLPFVMLMVSFAMKNHFSWLNHICLFLLLLPLFEERDSPPNISRTGVKEQSILPVFFWNFTVSGPTFKSLIHLEGLLYWYIWSSLILLHVLTYFPSIFY